MLAVNYSELRKNLKDYCDAAVDDLETVLVTRKDDKNVVVISLDEYNNLIENAHITKDPKYYKELIQRAEDVEKGIYKERELIDIEWKYYFTTRLFWNIYLGKILTKRL